MRHYTRKYLAKTVPEETINELLEMIRMSPSALNLEPWKIKIVTDQRLKEELLPATFNQTQVTSCSHLLVFCAYTDMEALIKKVSQMMHAAGVPDEMRNSMVGLAQGMSAGMTPDARLEWARCQVYLALGNAINGATSLGLGTCPMTGFNPAEYSRILELPADLVPTILCPVGYAADEPTPKLRFPKEDIFF